MDLDPQQDDDPPNSPSGSRHSPNEAAIATMVVEVLSSLEANSQDHHWHSAQDVLEKLRRNHPNTTFKANDESWITQVLRNAAAEGTVAVRNVYRSVPKIETMQQFSIRCPHCAEQNSPTRPRNTESITDRVKNDARYVNGCTHTPRCRRTVPMPLFGANVENDSDNDEGDRPRTMEKDTFNFRPRDNIYRTKQWLASPKSNYCTQCSPRHRVPYRQECTCQTRRNHSTSSSESGYDVRDRTPKQRRRSTPPPPISNRISRTHRCCHSNPACSKAKPPEYCAIQ